MVVSTSIWDHIRGDQTRMFLETLLLRARMGQKPVVIEYSCNGPTEGRLVEMTIKADTDGSVLISHRFLRIDSLPELVLDTSYPGDGRAPKWCSLCKSLNYGDGWIPVREFAAEQRISIRFAICPPCRKRIRNRQVQLRAAQNRS